MANDNSMKQVNEDGTWSNWRQFRCVNRQEECKNVVSFYFAPSDGGKIPSYLPGQFTTVRIVLPTSGTELIRCYTLSQSAGADLFRISVKREMGRCGTPDGLMSNHLHNNLKVGDTVELQAPAGEFFLETKENFPAVFIAAGIGITPINAMLEALTVENPLRDVKFVYSTQNLETYPLKSEVDKSLSMLPNAGRAVFFTQPAQTDRLREDFDSLGRIDGMALRAICTNIDNNYYICGPYSFMQAVVDELKAMGIIPSRIHFEALGAGCVEI